MNWVLVGAAAWALVAVVAALLVGRAIHLADRRAAETRAGGVTRMRSHRRRRGPHEPGMDVTGIPRLDVVKPWEPQTERTPSEPTSSLS